MKKKETVKTDKPKKGRKPYVQYETVWKSVGGGLASPGEKAIKRVGKHKVLIEREEKPDKDGKIIHSAILIKSNGKLGASAKGTGGVTSVTSDMLKNNGIEVKHKSRFPKKKKVNSGTRQSTQTIAKKSGKVEVVEKLPKGWRVLKGTLTQPRGTVWISNNKSLFSKGYKQKLLITDKELYKGE